MTPDLKNLELFLRVVRLGAIGKAGAEFGLSSTNASQRIQMLERDLGVKLFHRSTRVVTLTPDGEILRDYAERILNDVEDLRTVLSQDPAQARGLLRVTASATFAETHIIPFIPDFHRAHPQVQIDLNLTDQVLDIVALGFDLAFRIGELAPSSLLAQKVDDNPMTLVAHPDYLAAHGVPQVPQDLTDHLCLALGEARSWRLLGPDGQEHRVPVNAPLRSNFGAAIGAWVAAGMGIGMASLWKAGPGLKAGSIVRVLPDYTCLPKMDIWAVRPPGRLMPARVKLFLEFLGARIRATNEELYGSGLRDAGSR